ncbi:MAG TPA: DegT/DnrJ/EryC1/StrS family aminotransferase [Fibrobacter sp.]|nr:DegT/DnrJ/EryC1/StrS family aminotransferase [Fibrobacter sp.]
MIPFVNLPAQYKAHQCEINSAIEKVHHSGCYVGGPEVEAFERELEQYVDIAHAVTCASGTDAIFLALEALGLEEGDEVLVPDFSFIAPAECVRSLGGIPIFCDIHPGSFLIDETLIENRITSKTKGIVAVDLFGQCADFETLSKISQKYGLWIIEDAAQSFGATQNSKKACSFGDIAITSFYPTKPLGCCGDGGALFTSSKTLATRVRSLANHGSTERYRHDYIGRNSRLDAIQAAILKVKLKYFDDELAIRVANAKRYDSFFCEFSDIRTPQINAGNSSTYAQYTLRSPKRNDWEAQLQEAGIPFCIHYPQALRKQPCFLSLNSEGNPVTDLACDEVFSLPVCAYSEVDLAMLIGRRV